MRAVISSVGAPLGSNDDRKLRDDIWSIDKESKMELGEGSGIDRVGGEMVEVKGEDDDSPRKPGNWE